MAGSWHKFIAISQEFINLSIYCSTSLRLKDLIPTKTFLLSKFLTDIKLQPWGKIHSSTNKYYKKIVLDKTRKEEKDKKVWCIWGIDE